MSYKPILFNDEMVKAIQMGRKTQTRRLLRNISAYSIETGIPANKPPCKPGDILWVRETWQHVYNFDDGDQPIEGTGRYVYYADNPMPFDYWVDTDTGEHKEQMPWKPSIHMPKEAARIFLRVKDVRIELLRSVFFTDSAAILEVQKEGVDIGETCRACIEHYGCPCCIDADDDTECVELDNPRYVFSKLWDSTIKPADLPRHGWIANPWVWVIEFERCEKPVDWW